MALFDFHFDLGQWRIPFFRRKSKVALIVDDDPTTTLLIARGASANGLETEVASTGEEALGILHANGKRFVVAVIDVNLPALGGWELRRKIKDSWPRLRVIVISGGFDSFRDMPPGERVSVFLKSSDYGALFRDL